MYLDIPLSISVSPHQRISYHASYTHTHTLYRSIHLSIISFTPLSTSLSFPYLKLSSPHMQVFSSFTFPFVSLFTNFAAKPGIRHNVEANTKGNFHFFLRTFVSRHNSLRPPSTIIPHNNPSNIIQHLNYYLFPQLQSQSINPSL